MYRYLPSHGQNAQERKTPQEGHESGVPNMSICMRDIWEVDGAPCSYHANPVFDKHMNQQATGAQLVEPMLDATTQSSFPSATFTEMSEILPRTSQASFHPGFAAPAHFETNPSGLWKRIMEPFIPCSWRLNMRVIIIEWLTVT